MSKIAYFPAPEAAPVAAGPDRGKLLNMLGLLATFPPNDLD